MTDSIRQKIINVLIQEEFQTVGQISEKLDNMLKEKLSSYLNTLKSMGKIEVVDNKKKPFIYFAITPKAYLKKLYDFMGDYLIPLIPKEKLNEIPKKLFIKTIKEMIK